MKAIFHTCRAMHASLSGKADGQQNSFCHCERASGHLWNSLNVSGVTADPALNHVSRSLAGIWEVPSSGLYKCSHPSQACPAYWAVQETETILVAPFPKMHIVLGGCLFWFLGQACLHLHLS